MAPRAFPTILPHPLVFLLVFNFPSTPTTQPPPLKPPVLCISFLGAGMEPARGGGLAVLPPGKGLLSSTPSLSQSPPLYIHAHTLDGTIGSHCWGMGVLLPWGAEPQSPPRPK